MPQSFADDIRSIPVSPNLGQSLERARRFAREQAHKVVTLEHLLLALTEDPEAVIVLQASNVDLLRLTAEVSGYLGRLMEDVRAEPAVEPRPDAELLRVLQAATSAAQQSRRRQIDGAIVLAALVGDGKSPAAGILKALGMTFEEAIRALQRANAQARLKPLAKLGADAPAAGPLGGLAEPALPAEEPVDAAATAPPPARADEDAPARRRPQSFQSAEEILAAARTRILQRATVARAERLDASPDPEPAPRTPDPPAPSPAPEAAAPSPQMPQPAPAPAGAPDAPSEPHSRQVSAGSPEPAPPAPPAEADRDAAPQPRPDEPGWTPPSEAPPPFAARPGQVPPARSPPLPGRALQPGEGPPRPPLPRPSGLAARPPPARPAQAPWPDADRRGRPPGPMGGPDGLPGPPHRARDGAQAAPGTAPPSRPAQGRRAGGQAERGPLVESIPRHMGVGVPTMAEVRIARDKIEGLVLALNGRGITQRPDAVVVRALSVRLRAPNGGFSIEPVSPETQWAESASSLVHDDHASWRWRVTPQRVGRGKLLLTVSARTIGQDGLAAESSPPERMIEVRVGPNNIRRAMRWSMLIALFAAGVAIGAYGQQIWDGALMAIREALGG